MRKEIRNPAAWLAIVWIGVCHTLFAAPPAAPPAPPQEVVARDRPDDKGEIIKLNWQISPDDNPDAKPPVTGYRVERSSDGGKSWVTRAKVNAAADAFEDDKARNGVGYLYRVIALRGDEASTPAQAQAETRAATQAFDTKRAWFGGLLIIISSAVVYFIFSARSGKKLHLRKIPGLEVVDEAVGRATEMGRSCLFIPGIQDINDIQTIAGITILSRVVKTAAEYGARVEVPTARSLVMTTSREAAESAYMSAGRPDAYNEDDVYYVTDEQFGYVAFLVGKMVREKPAACFYMGAFFGEALILAETGNSINAIQLAGTAEPAQLPFFVAACDYTLIGEEFFAASAYLSGEPEQLGSLKGQDLGKLIVAALLLVGCIVATWASVAPDSDIAARTNKYIKETILSAEQVMKRTIPLLITLISGMTLIVASFIPSTKDWQNDVVTWFDILATIAFVLGGGNLLMIHLRKISDRLAGWGYSVVTLVAFVLTLVVGTLKVGTWPADVGERYGYTAAQLVLEDFPQTAETAGTLPDVEMPPDVKGQLTAADGKVFFRGWMTPQQRSELERAEYDADWHRVVKDLSEKSQPPAAVKDKVEFQAQLQRLFFLGVMSDPEADALASLSNDPNWTTAIQSIHTRSNETHSVSVEKLPPNYTIPEPLRSTIVYDADAKALRVTGPMSDAQYEALVTNFPPGAPLTAAEKQQLKDSLAALGPLDPALAAAIDRFVVGMPTVGERNHEVLFSFLKTAESDNVPTLNEQQRNFLLAQYDEQTVWRVQVGELFVAAHEVLYPFSGNNEDEGSAMWYIYEYAFKPLTSTIFALLAFYVASAAFRAFRAKNFEATLLLGTAFIVLLGRTYFGTVMTAWMPEQLSALTIPGLTLIIMSVFLTAGNRAIMIGIALGIVSTSLKILLGIDRSYLGSDRE